MPKHYLVTGASSGIGKASAALLLSQGHKVSAVARDLDKLTQLQKEYMSNELSVHSFDLVNTNEIASLVENLVAQHGKFDGLVHCAGAELSLPLSMTNSDSTKALYETNVYPSIELLRLFSKKKYSNDRASLVLISSVMSFLGEKGKTAYSSTKAAVSGMVKSAALELAKRKIRVNAICPGLVVTPLGKELMDKNGNEAELTSLHPLGLGQPEDIAQTISFLLNDGSKWVTGQDIVVDGGYSIS